MYADIREGLAQLDAEDEAISLSLRVLCAVKEESIVESTGSKHEGQLNDRI